MWNPYTGRPCRVYCTGLPIRNDQKFLWNILREIKLNSYLHSLLSLVTFVFKLLFLVLFVLRDLFSVLHNLLILCVVVCLHFCRLSHTSRFVSFQISRYSLFTVFTLLVRLPKQVWVVSLHLSSSPKRCVVELFIRRECRKLEVWSLLVQFHSNFVDELPVAIDFNCVRALHLWQQIEGMFWYFDTL